MTCEYERIQALLTTDPLSTQDQTLWREYIRLSYRAGVIPTLYLDYLNKEYQFQIPLTTLESELNVRINPSVFSGLHFPSLSAIDISHHSLDDPHLISSMSLPHLKSLYLRSNRLFNLFLPTSDSLINLNLRKNKFRSLDFLLSTPFSNLKDLNLAHNPISSFKLSAPLSLPSLITLNLSHTKIKSFKFIQMLCAPKLKSLDLVHTKLTSLFGIQRANFPNLEWLRLDSKSSYIYSELKNRSGDYVGCRLYKKSVLTYLSKCKFPSLKTISFTQFYSSTDQDIPSDSFDSANFLDHPRALNFLRKSFPHLMHLS